MVLDEYRVEIPEQFKKPNILCLFRSYDKQIREIEQVFEDIRLLTSLDFAVGKQLDMAGDIVGLTRAEAGMLSGDNIYFDVIDDDRYRAYLKYKAYQNSNECTYYDLINAMKMVWDVDAIYYSEEPLYPATIILTSPVLTPGGGEVHLGMIPSIRPAGVNVMYMYKARYVIDIGVSVEFYKTQYPECGYWVCGIYPGAAVKGYIGTDAIKAEAVRSVATNEYFLSGTRKCGIYF